MRTRARRWRAAAGRALRFWGGVFRRAPIGVLVISSLLFFLGAGFVMGGVFFALFGETVSWVTWLVLLVVGPLAVYVALSFVLLRWHAWLSVVVLLALLLISAVVRTFTSPAPPVAPVGEALIYLASLAYLRRPRVRRVFAFPEEPENQMERTHRPAV